MFEELCRKTGTIKIPTGTYSDSKPVFTEHAVTYFALDMSFRDNNGVLQTETAYYLKGYESPIPADSVFVNESGETFDISDAKYLYNHFDNKFEFNKFTVSHERRR